MRHNKRISLLGAAVALLLVVGMAPAAAGKPGSNPQTPVACQNVMTLKGAGTFDFVCTWKPQATANLATIELDLQAGALTSLLIMVRDYVPGDYCAVAPDPDPTDPWAIYETPFYPDPSGGAELVMTFPLVKDGSSYFTSPVDWCGTAFGDRDDALYLRLRGQKAKGTVMTITLDPPQV